MKLKMISVLAIFSIFLIAENTAMADQSRLKLFMADGQLRSHPVRVYVPETEITENMNPSLCLVQLGKKSAERIDQTGCPGTLHKPFAVAANQLWSDKSIEGLPPKMATLLLFSLKSISISPFLTGIRVLPILHWEKRDTNKKGSPGGEKTAKLTAISDREVYLSNRLGAIVWTMLTLFIFLLIAHWLTSRNNGSILELIAMRGGMSMSLTQMALWTIAVGSVVFGFGIMRLEVPEIPDTLVLLMGGAAGTAAIGHWQTHRFNGSKERKKKFIPITDDQNRNQENGKKPKWTDQLQTLFNIEIDGKIKLSLAKAQILFWTLLSLVLFTVKSVLEGQLWDVPYQLVALMGISQASFLTRNELAVRDEGQKAEDAEEEAKKEEQSNKSGESLTGQNEKQIKTTKKGKGSKKETQK